jgi:hypothetical protein
VATTQRRAKKPGTQKRNFIDVAQMAKNGQYETVKPARHPRTTAGGSQRVEDTAGSVVLSRRVSPASKKFFKK